MKRREMLLASGAAALGLSAFPFGWAAAAEKKNQKVLYFTRSAGFVHPMVVAKAARLALSEKVLVGLGKKNGFEVVCTKDGAVFDGDLDQYDCIVFLHLRQLTGKAECRSRASQCRPKARRSSWRPSRPARASWAFHSATDTFRSSGHRSVHRHDRRGVHHPRLATEGDDEGRRPEVPRHGRAGRRVRDDRGVVSFHKFAPDLHVISGAGDGRDAEAPYQRPPYPATWAHMHGKGRVFYTSMGHREDVWTNPKFRQVLLGGIAWAMGNAEADVTPNIAQVTPGANELKK